MINRLWLAPIAWVPVLFLANDARGVAPAGNHLQMVALTGDLAPGVAGRRFNSFDPPDVNDSGQVAFAALLDCCTPMATVYSTGRGALELVTFQGSPVEPGGQLEFANFRDVQIDNLGRTLIAGDMYDLPPEFGAVWIGQTAGMLTRIVVAGQTIDPSDPSSTYRLVGTPHLGHGGVLSGRSVSITSGSIAPSSDVLYESDGTGLAQLVLRAGDQLNFLPAGVVIGTYSDAAFDEPMVNKQGQIVVRTATIDTRGPNIEPFGHHLLVIEPDGSYASVANRMPGESPFGSLSLPVLNNHGAVAFGGQPAAQAALWRKLPGAAAEMVVREGDEPTGMPGVFFDDVFFNDDAEMPLWISDRGDVAFWASLVGAPIGPNFAESVWIGSPGNLRAVIVERTSAPGTGGVFASMSSTIGDMVRDMAVNRNSQVAVLAYFEVIPGDRRDGLFATDLEGNLHKIVAHGDMLEVAPGDIRQVDNVSFKGTAHQFQGSGLNDLGQVAFSVRFTDGTSGMFISSLVAIPEPTTGTTGVIGIAVVALRVFARRRSCKLRGRQEKRSEALTAFLLSGG